MQMEDEELKQYFQQARKPIKQDPSVKRKNGDDVDQNLQYKQKM